MTEHKFTDDEIVRALECCRDFGDCSLCPYAGATFEDEPDCAEKMHTDALDLINRQKAEIERLISRVSVLAEIEKDYALKYGNDFDVSIVKKQIKSEAIKEFAEKIKTDAEWICDDNYIERALIEYIDNLVKEMTEEKTKI